MVLTPVRLEEQNLTDTPVTAGTRHANANAVPAIPGETLTNILYHGCTRYVRVYISCAPPGQEHHNETARMWVEECLQSGILREWHRAKRRTIRVDIQILSRYVMTLAAVSRTWLDTVQHISSGQHVFLYDGTTLPGHWISLCTFLLNLQAQDVARLDFCKCNTS